MNCALQDLVEGAACRWRSARAELPVLGRTYSPFEQNAFEKQVDTCLERIEAQLRRVRSAQSAQQAMGGIIPAVVEIVAITTDLRDPQIDTLLRDGFAKISAELARWARHIDPSVSMDDILQASRNAWTACGLQLLLGKDVQLTPAIFGYSMLYPYSDNYLDDAQRDWPSKIRFNHRFRHRLRGEEVQAEDQHEAIIFQLIELIESQYPRVRYPEVFESLLAIHSAQTESLQQRSSDEQNLERITLTKGGTSVLADAWLATGKLTHAEAVFAFEWGVLLQLGDDLQDLREDQLNGSRTLFTEAAGQTQLDELTSRVFQFELGVRARMQDLPCCAPELRDLLTRSVSALLVRSAGANARFYSAPYLGAIECHSPLRFQFIESRQEWLQKRGRSSAKLFELFLASGPAELAS